MSFRRYMHVERFGNIEVEGIELGECFIFPKLDGCFPYKSKVMLSDGTSMMLGKIVNKRLEVEVLSYNFEKQKIESKKIKNWFRYTFNKENIEKEWVEFIVDRNNYKLISDQCANTRIRTTINHGIFVLNNGIVCEKQAKDIEVGDLVLAPVLELSTLQKQVMLGGFLGDGSAFPNKKRCNNGIIFSHGEKQKEYVEFKQKILNKNSEIKTQRHVDGYVKNSIRYRANSKVNSSTNEIYDICYKNNKKQITNEWLNQLNTFGIAIWYMDDGSLRNKKHAIFHTEGFSIKEQECICNFLNNRGYFCKIVDAKGYKQIRLNIDGSNNLFTDISSHIIKSMQYKLPNNFKNRYKEIFPDFDASIALSPRKVLFKRTGVSNMSDFNQAYTKFDIEVEDNHNYILNGILVHNSNGSIWVSDDNKIKTGSRNRQLSLEEDNHGFCKWVMDNKESFESYLKVFPNHILHGEWLVKHTLKTYRKDAWNKFYVFDVWDRVSEKYIEYNEYKPMLELHGIEFIPPLCVMRNATYEKLLVEVKNNTYLIEDGKGEGEGIVIKNYNYRNRYGRTTWAKIVTNEFKDTHRKNDPTVKQMKEMLEVQIVEKYVTKALVDKVYAKIVNENEGWTSKFIPRLLGEVYHDLVVEEIWDIVKKNKNPVINFKTLNTLTVMEIKKLKPELF